jgi:two-component system nitrate/nitrite response regulator NarL
MGDLPSLVRVAVVAEDPLVRSGLVSLLASDPGFSSLDPGALAKAQLAGADVTLWDVGPSAAAALDRSFFAERVPTLALAPDEEAALDLLRAGALGVLLRSVDGERLLAGLRAVASGVAVFEPGLLRALVSSRAAPGEGDSPTLTPRETEVLGLVAEGLSNKLIADRLKISEHTAKFHVNALLTKLSAETRTEAVVLAARRGLLML